jgi:hypothetical protein
MPIRPGRNFSKRESQEMVCKILPSAFFFVNGYVFVYLCACSVKYIYTIYFEIMEIWEKL